MEKVLLSISQLHHDPVGRGLLGPSTAHTVPNRSQGLGVQLLGWLPEGGTMLPGLRQLLFFVVQVCGSKVSRRQLVMKFCI